jgi:hypothetical protein
VDSGLLDGAGVGDVLNGAGTDLLNTSDLGNVLSGDTGVLGQPLASVDTNGSADGSFVVGGDEGDAANALISADVGGDAGVGDLGLDQISMPVDIGDLGDLGGLVDANAG